MLEKVFPGYLVCFLLSWYKEQLLCVYWGNKLSDSFAVSNGVRKRAVFVPVLFTLYIDNLLMKLKSLGVGCYWNGLFTGAVCHADDLHVALLALIFFCFKDHNSLLRRLCWLPWLTI